MARLDAAAHALLADANGHLYSARSLPSIIRNLEALGEFLRQMPTQRDNRVLAVAVQQKEKALEDIATTASQNGANISILSRKCREAQNHTLHTRQVLAEASDHVERARLEYEVAEEAANRLYRQYEEAHSTKECMMEAVNKAAEEDQACEEAFGHARANAEKENAAKLEMMFFCKRK